MDIEWVREFCLGLPHTTEDSPFGPDDLVFKVGGKMYAVVPLVPARTWLSFKSTPEEFAELVERAGVIPAPYLARNHWVALESQDALTRAEIKHLIQQSYDLVFAKLPRKVRNALL